MLVSVRVTNVLSLEIRRNDATLVMSLDITKGAWHAWGGGQLAKRTLPLYEDSPLNTMVVMGTSGPGLVYLTHTWYKVVRGREGNSHEYISWAEKG